MLNWHSCCILSQNCFTSILLAFLLRVDNGPRLGAEKLDHNMAGAGHGHGGGYRCAWIVADPLH